MIEGGGVEFHALLFLRAARVAEAKDVVGEGVLGVVAEGALAVGDDGVEVFALALAVAKAEIGHAAQFGPDVAQGGALLLADAG